MPRAFPVCATVTGCRFDFANDFNLVFDVMADVAGRVPAMN
jgi:hypothetical protein